MSQSNVKDVFILALPHRDWSCEAINYKVEICPLPGKIEKRNHTFFVIEDRFDIQTEIKSLKVLSRILLQRFPAIPANRMHILLHRADKTCALGVKVMLFDFYRDDNRQPQLTAKPTDVSAQNGYVRLCLF